MDKSTAGRKVEINALAPFSQPVHAFYRGETVRITHVGDATGMSPVYLVIDSQGKSAWVSQEDCSITDPAFLPLGQENLDLLSGSGSGSGSQSSSRTSRSAQPVG